MFHQVLKEPRSKTSIMIYPGEDAVKDLLLTFQSNFITRDDDEQIFFIHLEELFLLHDLSEVLQYVGVAVGDEITLIVRLGKFLEF